MTTIFDRLHAKTDAIRNQAREDILNVLTVHEVCEGWDKHENTVRQAIEYKNIVARKSGKAWIISYKSVIAWWGQPVIEFAEKMHEINIGVD